MSRRSLAVAAASAALFAGGLTPLLGSANAADCPAWTDPKGDANLNQSGIPGTEDANMDIVAASFGTVGDAVVAKITTDGLGEASSDIGDEFHVNFTVAGVNMQIYAARANGVSGQATPVAIADPVAEFYNLDTDATGAATVVFDAKTKTVVMTGKITELAKAAGKPVAGQEVTGLVAETLDIVGQPPANYTQMFGYDDAPTKLTTVIGGCGAGGGTAPEPAPSSTAPAPQPSSSAPASTTLTNAGATKAQYGDAAALAAKLVDGSGAPLSGKKISFSIGSATVTGLTDSNGIARASMPMKANAGRYSLKETWAGDEAAAGSSTSVAFTESVEVTRTSVKIVKSGSARTTTATVLDDDRHAVASQVVTFSVNNKKVATVRTNAKGQAVYKGAKAGQTVKASLGAVSGKYATSTASAKA